MPPQPAAAMGAGKRPQAGCRPENPAAVRARSAPGPPSHHRAPRDTVFLSRYFLHPGEGLYRGTDLWDRCAGAVAPGNCPWVGAGAGLQGSTSGGTQAQHCCCVGTHRQLFAGLRCQQRRRHSRRRRSGASKHTQAGCRPENPTAVLARSAPRALPRTTMHPRISRLYYCLAFLGLLWVTGGGSRGFTGTHLADRRIVFR